MRTSGGFGTTGIRSIQARTAAIASASPRFRAKGGIRVKGSRLSRRRRSSDRAASPGATTRGLARPIGFRAGPSINPCRARSVSKRASNRARTPSGRWQWAQFESRYDRNLLVERGRGVGERNEPGRIGQLRLVDARAKQPGAIPGDELILRPRRRPVELSGVHAQDVAGGRSMAHQALARTRVGPGLRPPAGGGLDGDLIGPAVVEKVGVGAVGPPSVGRAKG